MAKSFSGTNGQYKNSTVASESSKSPRPDPVADKIRELQEYDETDDEVSQTGNHNIVAMPGSTVHVHSDAEIELPMAKLPKWAKVIAAIVGGLAGLGAIAKAAYELIK